MPPGRNHDEPDGQKLPQARREIKLQTKVRQELVQAIEADAIVPGVRAHLSRVKDPGARNQFLNAIGDVTD